MNELPGIDALALGVRTALMAGESAALNAEGAIEGRGREGVPASELGEREG